MTNYTPSQFRVLLPEFSSTADYSDPAITTWLAVGYRFVNPHLWDVGDIDLGASLVAAHFLTLEQRDRKAARAGGVPGMQSGMLSSKSVGGVSASYDVALTAVQGAGQWNATSYGQRYATLAKLYGAGALQF